MRTRPFTTRSHSFTPPEVFDDKKTFTDWFDTMLDGAGGEDVESQLLANEKKLVVVHRLHQARRSDSMHVNTHHHMARHLPLGWREGWDAPYEMDVCIGSA